ncbi:hypothetical protein C5167_008249 [Papaver somniferum]|uniref:F-box domain-containing protein n=1 Tax=Papaver somniferum TaxID=3469 RepID=A0A4Y7JXU9_PAPSO|nr:hypothetical protein C5167_008249 [Papaver somniferum]
MATLFLPEHIILQILIWLPVRSLLRFKSVCTSWYALIQSPYFIKHHATTTTTVDDNNSKLGGTFICQHQRKLAFYLLSDKCLKEVEDLFERLCVLSEYQMTYRRAIRMVGCVHGIICMHNNVTGDIGLWNPATRQCRLLPKSLDLELELNPMGWYSPHSFVGLCFDIETNEYKVIRVSTFDRPYVENPYASVNSLRKVQIYCLGSDSWKLIDSDFHTNCYRLEGQGAGKSWNGFYFHQGVDHTVDPIKPFGLLDNETLSCYNSIIDEIVDLSFGEGIKLDLRSLQATIYKESLVSVDASHSTTKAISS